MAMLVLAGPDAPSIVERLLGALPPDAPWSHLVAKLGEIEIRAVRGGGETGAPEIWLVSAAAEGPAVWNALRDAGARPVGLTAEDALRVEAGTALYGHDVDETVLLPEIPLAHLVSYTKGCYIGQEVVVRIRDRGHVNRLLTGLRVEGREIPPHGARVRVDGQDVGQVTSAVWSFGLDAVVALGFVRRQHAAPGTAVTVAVDDQDVPAVVSALPFSR
jgi:folate-binding protein YgfZ